ncbi:MAG TPA: hypothetical protein VEY50_06500 [Lysobacter sp.]|nr:hypothetical protein [Lysobacter sp.]
MNDADATALLREIRDQQRQQLALANEALALQRQQFELTRSQLDRVERINDRAEALQNRASRNLRVIGWIALPVVLLLLAFLLWPYLRYLAYTLS